MITPQELQSSIDGYRYPVGEETTWAPYAMNGAPCAPGGDTLSIPEGGKASPERFQAIASFAVRHLVAIDREPTALAVRQTLIDGSLPVEDGIDYNYRGGVDCSGFAYFALKGCGVDIDKAIVVPPQAVYHAANWAGWQTDDSRLAELIEQAMDKALNVGDFARTFYDVPQPHKSVNVARFDDSSSPISLDDVQSGDIAIYRKKPKAAPSHIALIKDIDRHGTLQLVHSGRTDWTQGIGGVESFTIDGPKLTDYIDDERGSIELKRIDGIS